MSNLIFFALLSGLTWEAIVRMLDLEERSKGVGDGKIEGNKYTVIQRGDKISIVLPEYEPEEKCDEVVEKIFSKLDPKATVQVVKMGNISSFCNYCLKQTSLPYRCYRCNGWYCANHRLPEQHNCPGGKGRAEKVVEKIKPKKREKKKKEREIVVAEAPCG